MRVFAAVLLTMSLAAAPLLARNAGEAGKEETPAAASSATAAADQPRERAALAAPGNTEAVKPEGSAIETEMQDLRSLVEEQRAELEAQREALKAAEAKMKELEEKLSPAPAQPAPAAAAGPAATSAITSTAAPAEPSPASSAAEPIGPATTARAATPAAQSGNEEVSPLQLRIGSAYITPVGFMDATAVWSNSNRASGIGTNFAGIPYGDTTYQHNLSEARFSMQNSRVGFRVDAIVHDAHVIGYMESDFLGNNAANVAVSSNSNTLRSRLYWVDVRKGAWEILGGQTWSLATPNRFGVSPLPGDVFFSDNMDVNYQAGMVWGRIPEFRVAYHFPSDKAAFAIALDQSEPYVGGANGSGAATFPAAVSGTYPGGELNNGNTTVGAPSLAPDIIAKFVADPTRRLHFEVGGIARFFHVFNQSTQTKFSTTGGAGFVNLDLEIFKGFRLLTHNYWSDGGGRYIFGQAPDLTARPDGSPDLIHSESTVDGFEFTHHNTTLFSYYGLVYINRLVLADTGSSGSPLYGWGYTGSSNGQNRSIQEPTLGFVQYLWKDGKYGALSLIGQYSYVNRDPWFISPTTATASFPRNAHLSMAFLDLRYTLPGSAPTLGK
jgi:hypothetical protein